MLAKCIRPGPRAGCQRTRPRSLAARLNANSREAGPHIVKESDVQQTNGAGDRPGRPDTAPGGTGPARNRAPGAALAAAAERWSFVDAADWLQLGVLCEAAGHAIFHCASEDAKSPKQPGVTRILISDHGRKLALLYSVYGQPMQEWITYQLNCYRAYGWPREGYWNARDVDRYEVPFLPEVADLLPTLAGNHNGRHD
jgi:hypothetical protein